MSGRVKTRKNKTNPQGRIKPELNLHDSASTQRRVQCNLSRVRPSPEADLLACGLAVGLKPSRLDGLPCFIHFYSFSLSLLANVSCNFHVLYIWRKDLNPFFKNSFPPIYLFVIISFWSKKAAKHLVAASGHLRKAPRPEGGGSEGGPEREGLKPDLNRSSRQGAGGLGVSLSLSFPSVSSRLFQIWIGLCLLPFLSFLFLFIFLPFLRFHSRSGLVFVFFPFCLSSFFLSMDIYKFPRAV